MQELLAIWSAEFAVFWSGMQQGLTDKSDIINGRVRGMVSGLIWQLRRAGGPQMHTMHSFSFEREEWTELRCTSGLPEWTFAHVIVYCDWLCARPASPRCAWPIPVCRSANAFAGSKTVLVVCVGVRLALMGAGHALMAERSERADAVC